MACGAPGARHPDGEPDRATRAGAPDGPADGEASGTPGPDEALLGPHLVLAPSTGATEPAPVTATPLDAATAARLQAALPALDPPPGAPTPPPLRGPEEPADAVNRDAFPLVGSAAASPASELAARGAPVGEVERALRVSVTFDRPMLTDSEPVAVAALEPAVPGSWRWIGDRTLVFVPRSGVLPMATAFTATVREGARAADGSILRRNVVWRFATPPARIVRIIPDDDALVRRNTPIALVFDQEVDSGSALAAIRLVAAGRTQPLRLALESELGASPEVAAAVAAAGRRAVVLRPIAPLPDGEVATLTVGSGIRGVEGPRLSAEPRVYAVRTLAALAITRSRCGFGAACRPGDPWTLEFDHPLDEAAFDPALVTITPALAEHTATVAGRWLTVRASAPGNARYTVTVAPGLRDVHGQVLAARAGASFDVGPAAPSVTAPGGLLTSLVTGQPAVLTVTTVNVDALRVSIRRVTPADWPAWLVFTREAPRAITPLDPPGDLVASEVVTVAGAHDVAIETAIDLAAALSDGRGHLIVSVSPTAEPGTWYERRAVHRWVAASGLASAVWADGERVTAWVTDAASGASVADVEVVLGGGPEGAQIAARTDAEGLATLPLGTLGGERRGWLVLSRGADLALVPDGDTGLGGPSPWLRVASAERTRWLLLDGGAIGAPGEPWRARGWVRQITPPPATAVLRIPGEDARVTWAIHDARGRRLDRGEVALDANGGFAVDAGLSSRAVSGQATLSLALEQDGVASARHEHPLSVSDPAARDAAPRVDAAPATATGAGEVALSLRTRPTGEARPAQGTVRWSATSAALQAPALAPDGFAYTVAEVAETPAAATLSTRLDDAGDARAVLRLPADSPAPARVDVTAVVSDPAGAERAGYTSIAVTRAADAVGVRPTSSWAMAGDEVGVDLIAVASDGRPRIGRTLVLRAVAVGESTGSRAPRDVAVCTRTSEAAPVRCAWRPEAGTWTLEVVGPDGETAAATLVVVPSPEARGPATSLALIADHAVRRPGDTARILVRSPFATAAGVVTVARDGLIQAQRFSVAGGVAELALPVTGSWRPGVVIEARLVATTGTEAGQSATASVAVAVPAADRSLTVAVAAPAVTPPGSAPPLSVRVTDPSGAPVAGAAVALVATPFAGGEPAVPDPMGQFWSSRPSGVVARAMGERVPSSRPTASDLTAPGEGGAALTTPRASGELVSDGGVTDGEGRVELRWRVPRAVGGYRLDAVAVAGPDRFGRGEARVAVQDQVAIDVRWPSSLLVGDRVDVPVVLHNHGASAATVALVARAAGLDFPAGAAWRVEVPGGRSVAATLPMVAARVGSGAVAVAIETPGSARARIATGQVVVRSASTLRRRLVDGEVPRGGETLRIGAFDGARTFELRLAATDAVALAGAVLALDEADSDGPEPLASRVIAWSALLDVERLAAAAGLGDADAVRARIARDLDALRRLQDDDGGFSLWRRGAAPWPWVSIHVAHALARARAVGVGPPGERSRRYLAQVDRHVPRGCGPRARAALVAYALYVRALLGDEDVERAKALVTEGGVEGLEPEAAAMLLSVLRRKRAARGEEAQLRSALERWIARGAARPQAAAADALVTLGTPTRALAVVLDAWVTDGPRGGAIDGLAAELLATRDGAGSFGGDEADAWAVVALSRAAASRERERPDVTARAWVDGALRVDERIRARGGVAPPVSVAVPARSELRVTLERRGSGPLHYALIEAGADPPAPRADGFVVSRRYVAVDDPSDVRRDGDGTWRLRLGARVRVLVTVITTATRRQVEVLAPGIPGLSVDPATAMADGVSARDARAPRGTAWTFDDDLAVHLSSLVDGPHVFSYEARTTLRGRVTVPAATARELADRRVRGRSAPDIVRIE